MSTSPSDLSCTKSEYLTLKRLLKLSKENIRNSRHEFFNSPTISTRTPTPSDSFNIRDSDSLDIQEERGLCYEKAEQRLPIPSIFITSNLMLPTMESAPSLDLQCASEDEAVVLRHRSHHQHHQNCLFPANVARSRSFQEQGNYYPQTQSTGRFSVKRVSSDMDGIFPKHLHESTMSNLDHQPTYQRTRNSMESLNLNWEHCSSADDKSPIPKVQKTDLDEIKGDHVFGRFFTRMRKITSDWRKTRRKVRRGETIFSNGDL